MRGWKSPEAIGDAMIGHPAPGAVVKARPVPRIVFKYPIVTIKEKIATGNIDTVVHAKARDDL
ncbi:MAG: hypothetical protein EBR00_04075 [Gammaproteobacteria bacterium]|jgi:hypothetical protein|nr:hypothetical protein [Gammaproteobacteria bacterium]